MKRFFARHWLKLAGLIVGAAGGYLYYYFVGCGTGTCPITSNPWRITLYGGIMGLLFFDVFSKKTPSTIDQPKEKS